MYGEVLRGRSWEERKRGAGGIRGCGGHIFQCRGCRSWLGMKSASDSWVAGLWNGFESRKWSSALCECKGSTRYRRPRFLFEDNEILKCTLFR